MPKIIIQGKPIAKKRPRFTKQGFAYNAQSKEMKETKEEIEKQWNHDIIKEPVSIRARFYMPIPKAIGSKKKRALLFNKYHSKKPDIDNLLKYYFDCMNGICFVDDSQISAVDAKKIYSDEPRTEILIRKL